MMTWLFLAKGKPSHAPRAPEMARNSVSPSSPGKLHSEIICYEAIKWTFLKQMDHTDKEACANHGVPFGPLQVLSDADTSASL